MALSRRGRWNGLGQEIQFGFKQFVYEIMSDRTVFKVHFKRVHAIECAVVKERLAKLIPDMFLRVEFWRIGRQENGSQVFGQFNLLRIVQLAPTERPIAIAVCFRLKPSTSGRTVACAARNSSTVVAFLSNL